MPDRQLPASYPLIEAIELKALMSASAEQTAGLHVLDCRFELARPAQGRLDFETGHIPGARYVHIDNDLCSEKTGQNGRHPMPDFFEFVLRTRQWGLGKDDLIVAMDASNAMVAGRLWWMLRWAGYPKVKVLNGGWAAWLKAGGSVQSAAAAVTGLPAEGRNSFVTEGDGTGTAEVAGAEGVIATNTADATPAMQTVDVHSVVANLEKREFRILDGRDRERFTGERDTMDPVAGHIPGAQNRCFLDNLNADGTFKSAEQLKQEFSDLLGPVRPEDIVHSCGSGVTACNNLLAMEIAGLSGSRLYPGSWSEYCADPSRPVERGG